MGNRSAIFIKQNERNDCIVIYSHWEGMSIGKSLKHALQIAKSRTDDIDYFNRIIIQNVLNSYADPNSATGAGIGYLPGNDKNEVDIDVYDLDNPGIIVDPYFKTVTTGQHTYSFDQIMGEGMIFC